MSQGTLGPSTVLPRERWLALGLVVLILGVSVQYGIKISSGRSAIIRWLPSLGGLDEGEDVYTKFNYPNPPIMGMILSPLAKLPPVAAALCWFYLKAGLTLLTLAWVFRLVQGPDQPAPPWAKEATVLLSLWPIVGDLTHGNVNLFILFLVVGSLYAFTRERRFLAGVVLALAIACKVTPALFLPYFAWKRSWRTLLGAAAGLLLFLCLIPSAKLGMSKNNELLQSWWRQMVEPYLGSNKVTSEYPNQSLPGLVTRLATHNPSFITYVNDQYTPLHYDNWLELEPAVAGWLVKGCMGLFVVVVLTTCRTPTTPGGWRLAAEFSIVVLGMLLFSERTWKQHAVTLVLPFAVMLYALARAGIRGGLRRYVIGCLVLAALLMASASISALDYLDGTARTIPWHGVSRIAQAYGAYVWAYLVLLTGLTALLLSRPSSDHPGEGMKNEE
jgi:hypothetical protein